MVIEYIEVEMTLDYGLLGEDMRLFRQEHDLTQYECNELIGTKSAWSLLETAQQKKNGSQVSMGVFLTVCNLIGADPRRYFCFYDRVKPLTKRTR